jgi:conjugal transfer mating pair stabilization protein TraG
MITIHILGFSDLYCKLLNAMATFMNQDGFTSLLRITALIGIIMATVGYLKKHDPMIYGKWVLMYVVVFQVAILPKTSVAVEDISNQSVKVVDNVPVIFAVTTSFITTIGVSLAESFDMLLSEPDDLTYTKTGSLFGSRIIQASRNFRIIDSQLKSEMNGYLRNCVIGDIRLNKKYSMSDLGNSTNLWSLISKQPSPIRMTEVNGGAMSCLAATPVLKKKLNAEVKNAYSFFGIELFDHQTSTYETLFETNLKSAFKYFKNMSDTSSDIFLQSMMINAIGDGIKDYQTLTDSTAGVVNNLVTKSEVQHRWSWAIAGQKAAWFLPILYTVLSLLLFGIFPIILVMTTLPNGVRIFQGYLQFFISLQFWPLLFAILNALMTAYGAHQSSKHGAITLVNIDKIDELHTDLAGVAGYLMLMIPFIAKGLVSNFSDSFNNLATSMTGHLQGSAMSVANDAASASFSLGQTSFYNASANNLSANKHDINWTNMHGMHTEQLSTGVTKTHTGSGDTVFDVSQGMTKSAVSMSSNKGITGSLNEAFETSQQASIAEHENLQTALSNASHKAILLSQLDGHDLRLGDGVSRNETAEYQASLSKMNQIATDVGHRTGVSTDEAMQGLISAGIGVKASISSEKGVLGHIAKKAIGFDLSGNVHGKYDRSSTTADRSHDGNERGITARDSEDFNAAFRHAQNFIKNHHFDNSTSTAANLSNQMGADLRHAETASKNYDASLTRLERISQASSYVASQGSQITTNLEQQFPAFVENRVGSAARDQLFSHPGDAGSVQTLQNLSHDFLQKERETIIAKFGHSNSSVEPMYNKGVNDIHQKSQIVEGNYEASTRGISSDAKSLNLGVNEEDKKALGTRVDTSMSIISDDVLDGDKKINAVARKRVETVNRGIDVGRENANRFVISSKKHANNQTNEQDKK